MNSKNSKQTPSIEKLSKLLILDRVPKALNAKISARPSRSLKRMKSYKPLNISEKRKLRRIIHNSELIDS